MLWPSADERRLLGRFYLAGSLGYGLSIIAPFEFAYLFLVMDRPEWAIIPFIVSTLTVLVLEIPTGILSDRWSRKKAAMTGYAVSACSWVLIPLAASQEGPTQLAAVCACFVLDGIGEALASGAEDAWVVDNLREEERADLVDQFFARSYSFESLGSALAGTLAFAIVATTAVTGSLLDVFWYVTAAGQALVLLIAATIPEHRPRMSAPEPVDSAPGSFREIVDGARAILRMRPLVFFVAAVVVASFADSVTEDAFVMSMITKGLDARALAPLAIAEDMIGLAAPIFAVSLARRMGVSRYLSVFLIVPALAVSVLFLDPALWVVVALCLLLDTCEVLWDPVADARLHALIPSRRRATIASVVNQLNGLVTLAGLVIFSLIIGRHSEALDAALPDIVTAFSGEFDAQPEMPEAALGLPIPDLAIVLFVLAGLLAIPLLRAAAKRREP